MSVSFEKLQQEIADSGSVVALCPGCNRIVFCAVNHPKVMDYEMRREIAELAISGRTIKHMTIAEVRKAQFGCKCYKP